MSNGHVGVAGLQEMVRVTWSFSASVTFTVNILVPTPDVTGTVTFSENKLIVVQFTFLSFFLVVYIL
jgi:hypothetical protein